jgi:protein-L-isoaspartate(D-aspartate) O-methyltransferase
MVDQQLRRQGITDERVLAAMLEIPARNSSSRVSGPQLSRRPRRIGWGQTISQPLHDGSDGAVPELKGTGDDSRVGAGSGYAAAVLGALGARVISIELIPAPRPARCSETWSGLGRAGNVRIVTGDGSVGFPSARRTTPSQSRRLRLKCLPRSSINCATKDGW